MRLEGEIGPKKSSINNLETKKKLDLEALSSKYDLVPKKVLALEYKNIDDKQMKKSSLESLGFKSIENKIKEAIKFSESNPESNFSVSEFNELAKEVYTIKDENIRNKFVEELINIQTKINNQINLHTTQTNTLLNNISSTPPSPPSPSSPPNPPSPPLPPSPTPPVPPTPPHIPGRKKSFSSQERLTNKGIGWTHNEKVSNFIERMFTDDPIKLAKEVGLLAGLNGSKLFTGLLGIDKNRNKIVKALKDVLDNKGFKKILSENKIDTENLKGLLDKLKKSGADLFKNKEDKLTNQERQLLKKTLTIYNNYIESEDYEEDKYIKDKIKQNEDINKTTGKIKRLTESLRKSDLKETIQDMKNIIKDEYTLDLIFSLEKASKLSMTPTETVEDFIRRAVNEMRNDRILSGTDLAEINRNIRNTP